MGKSWIKNHKYSFIGKNVIFNENSYIGGNPIEIKKNTIVEGFLSTRGDANITIGKYCHVGKNLFVVASYKPIDLDYLKGRVIIPKPIKEGPVYIGNNIYIGNDVIILPGISIGDGALIEHKSVVMKDVGPFSVYAGNPAQFVRYRFSKKIIDKIKNFHGWHLDETTMLKNKLVFPLKINMSEESLEQLIKVIKQIKGKEMTEIIMNNQQSGDYLLEGWGYQEINSRWVLNNRASFVLKTNTHRTAAILALCGFSYYKSQQVKIYLNDLELGILSIANSLNTYRIKIPDLKVGINKFSMRFSQSFRPIDVDKKSKDKRRLFCLFQRIYIE